jgi:hypothetical protein
MIEETSLIKKNIFKAVFRKYNFEKSYKEKIKRAMGNIRVIYALNYIMKKEKAKIEKREEEKNVLINNQQIEEKKQANNNNNYIRNETKNNIINKELINKNTSNEKNKDFNKYFQKPFKFLIKKNALNNETGINEKRPYRIIDKKKSKKKIFDLVPEDYIFENFNEKLEDSINNNQIISLFNNDNSQLNLVNKNKKIKIISIEKVNDFYYIAKKERKNKKYSKLFLIKERSFNLIIKNTKIICFQISITNYVSIIDKKQLTRSYMKTVLVVLLYFILWFYLAVFIQDIYMQYADNIIKLCVMPLVSMIVIKLCITVNILILIATIILYFFGKYYLSRRPEKYELIPFIVLKAFVPDLAFKHYQALNMYLQYTKDW